MDAHTLECLDFPRVRELLAEHALTALGRALAGQIRPSTRAAMVERWLRQVQELQQLALERGLPPLGALTDVREIVTRCAPPLRVTVDEMARVGDALAATHAVAQYLADLPERFPELRHLAERVGDFATVAARVRGVIDERGLIRDDASPKLRRIRHDIERATARIAETVSQLLHDPGVRRLLQYPNPTFHSDRIVLPVRTEYRGRLPGIVHRTSDSGATMYVEPAQAVELNNQIINLRVEEQEECNRLLWELAHEVHGNSHEILRSLDTLAVIDLVVAKVRLAETFELRCPAINADGRLNVRQARHPLLLDLARRQRRGGEPAGEVVPIDYRIGEDFDLLVITGPNTGGKTVTLKTIGLINLMVQAGLPAPVGAGSSVGLFHEVLVDIGDEQSMQQSLSTFSAHLKRLLEMLRHASQKSLMLIDELGAGTDPEEGAAIGQAVLDELLRLQTRGVVTTHLGALKAYPLTRQRVENAAVEFDMRTLRPTYRLRIGEAGSSNAIDVALRLGMPRRLAAAARRALSRQARVLGAALRGTATAKRQAEDARRAADDARLQASRAQDEAHVARSRLERQQVEFQTWVQRVVHLQAGDPVRVRNFDRDGRVVRVRLDQQRAEVDVGAFSVEVPLGDVLPPETAPPPPRPLARPAAAPVRPPASPEAKAAVAAKPAAGGGAPPTGGRERAGAVRGPRPGHAPPRPDPRPLPPLTDEQAEALQPGDAVFVKRFQRQGRVARLKPAKKLIVVSMGLLEVEVPYDGLGLPSARPTPAPRPARESTAGPGLGNVPRGPDVASGDAAVPPGA